VCVGKNVSIFGRFPMAGAPSEVAALSDQLHLLAMLATNSVAKQGLVAVLRAGRKNGLHTATFAGVTLTVGSTPTAEKVQVQPKKGSTSNGRSRAPVTGSLAATSRRRGRKSAAQRKRDAEKYAAKRMRRKFLPVMHLVDKFIREQQQQQPLDMDEGEPPQFGEPPAGTSGTSRAMQVANNQSLQFARNSQKVDLPATATMTGRKHAISSPSRPAGRDTRQQPKRGKEAARGATQPG
jgi:hypothetical protein